MQREILKYNPHLYSLSKDEYNKNLYYEYQCDLPISKEELLRYVFDENPGKFSIFAEQQDYLSCFNFDKYDTHIYQYDVEYLKIGHIYTDWEGVIYDIENNSRFIHGSVGLASLIENIYHQFNPIYFDIDTIFNILSRRKSCLRINPYYNKIQTINILYNIIYPIQVEDLDTFYGWVKQLYYLKHHNITSFPKTFIQNIKFNNNNVTKNQEILLKNLVSNHNYRFSIDNVVDYVDTL